jgi:hypothetical protein
MKLPKFLYLAWQNDTGLKGDGFLRTEYDPEGFAEIGSTRTVGVYKLVGTAKVKGTAVLDIKLDKKK